MTVKGPEVDPPCHFEPLPLVVGAAAALVLELLLHLRLLTLALGEGWGDTGASRGASAPPAATNPGGGAQVRQKKFTSDKKGLAKCL